MGEASQSPSRAGASMSHVHTVDQPHCTADEEYVAFGNVESRNGLQERVEIPLMLRALALPRGGRVLEVGCGRGIALAVLSARLQPARLVGIDIDPVAVTEAQRRVRAIGADATVMH